VTWPTFPADVLEALPVAAATEQEFQGAYWVAIPRVLPVLFHRQITGRHRQARGGWMRGAPRGAADLSGWARGGLRIELEFKYADGPLTREQERWRSVCLGWGVVHRVPRYDVSLSLLENLTREARALRDELTGRSVDVVSPW
jgi:hypothetical protein